ALLEELVELIRRNQHRDVDILRGRAVHSAALYGDLVRRNRFATWGCQETCDLRFELPARTFERSLVLEPVRKPARSRRCEVVDPGVHACVKIRVPGRLTIVRELLVLELHLTTQIRALLD